MIEKLPTPKELVARLDETVIGQEEAKNVLALAVYKHYLRQMQQDRNGVKMEKSNLLFLGPSGCGKTLLVHTIAKLIDVPFIDVDANCYSPGSYKGTDMDEIVKKLYIEAGKDTKAAERGIIFLDEFDKIVSPAGAPSNHRSCSVGIQSGYLKMLEGVEVLVNMGRGSVVPVNTSEILFICSGAFTGLDRIVERRLNGSPTTDCETKTEGICNFDRGAGVKKEKKDLFIAGFGRPLKETLVTGGEKDDAGRTHPKGSLLKQVEVEDLIEFGLIPELLGRLQHKVVLDGLGEDALVDIMTKPKNAVLKQFRQEFLLADTDLIFTPDAIRVVARKALKDGTGARGLRSILDKLLSKSQFEALSYDHLGETVVVDGDAAAGKYPPKFIKNSECICL